MAFNLIISNNPIEDAKYFAGLFAARERVIQSTPIAPLPKELKSNRKARLLHPDRQKVVLAEKIKNGPDAYTLVLKTPDGSPLAPFRAGQYISVVFAIGNTITTRSYSLCGSPAWAKDGIYHITVKLVTDDGFVSPYVHSTLAEGAELVISGPQGNLYYEPLRDCRKVLGLAGGSGITPFLGMAYAIRDGYEDFDLTILFGSRTEDAIVCREELDGLCAACDKVHVVHVLSDEEKEGFEYGFLSAEIIRKYAAGEEVSLFMCGPQAMYNFLDGEIEKLGYDRKHVRRELFGAIKDPWNQPGYPVEMKGKVFQAKVLVAGNEYSIPVSADEPILVALERAGIKAPSRCRSGECGWCRSRLLDGQVFIPEKTDGRREADKEYGYIHPCSSFALSDLRIEVPGQYLC